MLLTGQSVQFLIHQASFFLSGWRIYDFVAVSLTVVGVGIGSSFLSILRSGRCFRLLNLSRRGTLAEAFLTLTRIVPVVFAVGAFIGIFLTVYALLGVSKFGQVRTVTATTSAQSQQRLAQRSSTVVSTLHVPRCMLSSVLQL